MARHRRRRKRAVYVHAIVAGLALSFGVTNAFAQQIVGAPNRGPAEDTLSILSPKPMALRTLRDKPVRDYQGLPIAGWMLYPTFLIGGTFDDNVFQSSFQRVSAGGLHLRPGLVAERDTGIHKTQLYTVGDFRIYPDRPEGNIVNLQVGGRHIWEVRRDLTLTAEGQYRRQTDMYNTGLVVGPFGGAGFIASPQRYNQFIGSVSGVKSFNRFFVALRSTAVGTTFDTLYTTNAQISQSYRDNIYTGVTGRFGYMITPLMYGFVESTGNFRDFSDTIYNSQGYRIVGGLGTDRISLFRGEVYAGYQRQIYSSLIFGAPSSPVIGGKLFWYPTRAITVTAGVDQTFADSALATIGNLTGSAARMISAWTRINYAMSRSWSASLRGEYDDLRYITGGRHDARWLAGAQIRYEIFRNLAATFEYSFATVSSSVPSASFTRNTFTLGATYKY